jgi:hypothetical protein
VQVSGSALQNGSSGGAVDRVEIEPSEVMAYQVGDANGPAK